jgi:hypothetical protein
MMFVDYNERVEQQGMIADELKQRRSEIHAHTQDFEKRPIGYIWERSFVDDDLNLTVCGAKGKKYHFETIDELEKYARHVDFEMCNKGRKNQVYGREMENTMLVSYRVYEKIREADEEINEGSMFVGFRKERNFR